MREESIVYFYLDKKQCSRKYIWQKPKLTAKAKHMNLPGSAFVFQVYEIGIPETERPGHPWDLEKLNGQVKQELERWDDSPEAYYLREPGTENLIRLSLEPLPERFREAVLETITGYDALVILDGPWVNTEEILELHCDRLRFLAVVSEREERFQELAEDIYEEYGLVCRLVKYMEQMIWQEGLQYLIIDGSEEAGPSYGRLPRNSRYFDLKSDGYRQHLLQARRKDVEYISFFQLFLSSYVPIS